MVATLVLPHRPSSRECVLPSRNDTSCPECGVNQPVTTPEGFTVCPACGSEYPDSQPFVCTDPLGHDKGVIQSHMVSRKGGSTMIGTKAERAKCAKVAPNLEWAEKFGQTYEQEVFQRAYFEIRKIFTVLDLSDRAVLFDAAMNGFVKAYKVIPKGTRNRNVHLLALVASYRSLRAAKIPLLLKNYLATCLDKTQFTARQFLTTLKDTTNAFPRADPNEMVRFEVSALVSRLGIPKTIQDAIATIMKYHVGAFHSPKTAVRSAAIVSTAALATNTRNKFPFSMIARSSGIATSAAIRCIIDACANYHVTLEGSLVYAGDIMRSLFLAPGKVMKPETLCTKILNTHVQAITKQTMLPKMVTKVAMNIALTHPDVFLQRSVQRSTGAIISTAILTLRSRKKVPIMTGANHANTNFSTMARYINEACLRIGHPPPVKLVRAGYHLHSLFFNEPPSIYDAHQSGPPLNAQEDSIPENLDDGPPSYILRISSSRTWLTPLQNALVMA